MDGGRMLDLLDLLILAGVLLAGALIFAGMVAVAASKAKTNKAALIFHRKKYPALVKTKAAGTSESDDDPVRVWLPAGKYEKLTEADRNQLALDHWKAQTWHSAWEIGREYERFVGFLFESKLGYDVAYDGAIAGYGDMRRFLICKRDNQTLFVQCEYWRPETVREKHVFALFGCALEYCFSNGLPFGAVRPVLLIKKTLSPEAKKAAEFLKVAVCENAPMDPGYPRIKCNIASDGEKIFHLPFDQMYDHAKIKNPGECYVATVAEAMELGFRRAWKWREAGQQTAA